MLSKMDDLEIFDRSNGVTPFLLYNGHGSRFEEPLLKYTLESNMPWTATLEKSDIVQIFNVAWKKSFARVDTNKRAITACGWVPLKYILLDHPEHVEHR
jgi:hypothetical protein